MKDLKKFLQKQKVKKLMVVFPHPDDESFATGGLLLVAKKMGWETYVVLLTKGGAGKIHINPNGKSAKEVRMHEAQKAAKILNVDRLILGDFDDGKLKQQKEKWSKWLKTQIDKINPSVVVSFDHTGITGHPDHISLSLELKRLVLLRKNSPNLFWVCVPDKHKEKVMDKKMVRYSSKPTYELNLGSHVIKKLFAIYVHKSQKTIPFSKLVFLLFMMRSEWYYKVDFTKKYGYKYIKFEI